MKRKIINKFIKHLDITDYYSLSILTIYTILAVIYFKFIPSAIFLISENILIAFSIFFMSFYACKYPANYKFLLFKRIMLAPIVFLIYIQVQAYLRVVNPYFYDDMLIKIDFFLFCNHPTEILSHISFPLLTEYLQLAYMTYFIMPVIHGIELHKKGDPKKFNYFAGLLIFSYYLSYLLYFIFPAIGPRFTLHCFSDLSSELPGLFATDFLRAIINFGGGIVNNLQDPAMLVNRDCMPSGHTLITTINTFVAFKLKSRYRWFFLILGSSLIFSTVYLRYHYAIDLLVSFILVPLILWIEPKLQNFLLNTRIK